MPIMTMFQGNEGLMIQDRRLVVGTYNIYAGGYYQANREKQQVNVLKEKQSKNNIKLQVEENLDYAWIAHEELEETDALFKRAPRLYGQNSRVVFKRV